MNQKTYFVIAWLILKSLVISCDNSSNLSGGSEQPIDLDSSVNPEGILASPVESSEFVTADSTGDADAKILISERPIEEVVKYPDRLSEAEWNEINSFLPILFSLFHFFYM